MVYDLGFRGWCCQDALAYQVPLLRVPAKARLLFFIRQSRVSLRNTQNPQPKILSPEPQTNFSSTQTEASSETAEQQGRRGYTDKLTFLFVYAMAMFRASGVGIKVYLRLQPAFTVIAVTPKCYALKVYITNHA